MLKAKIDGELAMVADVAEALRLTEIGVDTLKRRPGP